MHLKGLHPLLILKPNSPRSQEIFHQHGPIVIMNFRMWDSWLHKSLWSHKKERWDEWRENKIKPPLFLCKTKALKNSKCIPGYKIQWRWIGIIKQIRHLTCHWPLQTTSGINDYRTRILTEKTINYDNLWEQLNGDNEVLKPLKLNSHLREIFYFHFHN